MDLCTWWGGGKHDFKMKSTFHSCKEVYRARYPINYSLAPKERETNKKKTEENKIHDMYESLSYLYLFIFSLK